MTKEQLALEIYDTAHLTGKFLLRSGSFSSEYFDKYQFESRPDLLMEIAEHMLKILPDDYDLLAGLEMGGIPLATALSFKTGKPAVFVRKKAKEYGTAKLAEGPDIEGKRLLIIEDVITSGGQVVISSRDLKDRGALIVGAVCVIDRESGGREALAEKAIKLNSLFTMSELKKIKGI